MGKTRTCLVAEMMDYCENNEVYWFHELASYASKNHKEWHQVLCGKQGTITMSLYLASKARNVGLISDAQYEECFIDLDG